MPAASKQQQKLMGIVHAIQKGDMKPSAASKQAQKMAKSMTPGDVKKFAGTKHKGLPKKVKTKKEEGIHDRDITSASHTNIKTPPKGVGDYNAKDRADNLKKLADFGPKGKKEEGVLEQVYAVQKPYSGCQLTSLVHPIDPLVGLDGSSVVPDQVHGVYHDQDQANAVAQEVYEAYCKQEEALEEKKHKVLDKIKKTMSELEKRRSACVEAIKENPMDATKYKEEAAKHTTTIDELVNKLERIEKSKKSIDKKKEEK